MSKKLKIILAVAAGVVILSLGGGAVVMAAASTTTAATTTAPQSNPLFSKVAAALGVTEAQLTTAFQQADSQAQSTAIDKALAQAVTDGKITQAESDAVKAWLAQRPADPTKDNMKAWEDSKPTLANPDALKGIIGFGGGMIGPFCGPDSNNTDLLTQVVSLLNTATGKSITVSQLQDALTKAEAQMKSDAVTNSLADAVKNGKITQDEANQIQSWWDQRPAAVDKLPGGGFGFPGMGRGRGGMMPGFRGGMMDNGSPSGQAQ